MRVDADFAGPAFARTAGMDWTPSPTAGVERRMLDRVADEVARATSLVRYAPRSRFPEHSHARSEEFLVLEGVSPTSTANTRPETGCVCRRAAATP